MKESMKENNWKDLGIKDKLAIGTAVAAFAIGWILVGTAALIPLYLSEQSVLWILGQSLIYSASVFGITGYFNSETRRLRSDIRTFMHEEKRKLEEGFEEEKPE